MRFRGIVYTNIDFYFAYDTLELISTAPDISVAEPWHKEHVASEKNYLIA